MRKIDIRLVIGFILVVASIVGVYGLVSAADRTTAVFAASRPLAAGTTVQASDLVVVHVRLASATALYMGADDVHEGAVLLRALGSGELVPSAAIGSARDIISTTLVLNLGSQLPAQTAGGSVVDLWTAPQLGQNTYGPPTVLVAQAQIARVIESSGIGSSAQGTQVEVVIPRSKVALVLQAQANGDVISVVPTTGLPIEAGTGS